MAIDYDKLNAAYAMLRSLKQACVDGYITQAELEAQRTVIKNDIREILGFPPIVP